jgi:hypothetical protein
MDTSNHFQVFDYTDSRGRNVMQDWADDLPMSKKDRVRLDLRIDLLEKEGDNLFPKMLQSTRKRHILEIAVNGQVALRPMLCRGPSAIDKEYTLLFGAVEKNRKYVPRDAPDRAETNRIDLAAHPEKRCNHERFNKNIEEGV